MLCGDGQHESNVYSSRCNAGTWCDPRRRDLLGSFTLGSGQFCTKPGLVFVPKAETAELVHGLENSVGTLGPYGMLTKAIATKYTSSVKKRMDEGSVRVIAETKATLKRTARLVQRSYSRSLWKSFLRIRSWKKKFSDQQRCWSTMEKKKRS